MHSQTRVPMRQLSSANSFNINQNQSPPFLHDGGKYDENSYAQANNGNGLPIVTKNVTTDGRSLRGRQSMGPGVSIPRLSIGGVTMNTTAKKKNKTKQRMSMLPSTTARRQSTVSALSFCDGAPRNGIPSSNATSVGGSRRKSIATVLSGRGGGGILKADPRPLGSKAFMITSIEKLIQFLVMHGYDEAVSPKILHRPTGKDFENVARFLFGLLDPHGNKSVKFADEVVTVFKFLRYPFSISKTALAAVGSPHTWPALLATLTWLVDVLQYSEYAHLEADDFEIDFLSPDQEADSDKQFFVYLSRAYAFFLAGDDVKHKELDDERRELFTQELKEQREAIEQLRSTKEKFDQQLIGIRDVSSDLPRAEKERSDKQVDLLKLQKLLNKYEEHRDILQKKVRRDDSACRTLEEELSEAVCSKEDLQRILDDQELSPADAESMNIERRRLIEELDREMEKRDQLTQIIHERNGSLEVKIRAVETGIEEYNHIAQTMKLVQQFGGGSSFVLRFDSETVEVVAAATNDTFIDVQDGNKGQNEILRRSVADTNAIMNGLRELYEVSHNRLHHIKTESMALRLDVEKNEEEKAVVQAEVHRLEQQLEKMEEDFQCAKRDMERELSTRATETEQLEEDIHSLSVEYTTLLQPELRNAKQRRFDLERSAEEQRMALDELLRRVDEELENAMHSCINHQEKATSLFENLEADLKSRNKSAEAQCAQQNGDIQQLI